MTPNFQLRVQGVVHLNSAFSSARLSGPGSRVTVPFSIRFAGAPLPLPRLLRLLGQHRALLSVDPQVLLYPQTLTVRLLLQAFLQFQILSPLFSPFRFRSEEHTSELQSQSNLVCRLLLEKK